MGNRITEVCDYGVESCLICNAICQEVQGQTFQCGDGDIDLVFGAMAINFGQAPG